MLFYRVSCTVQFKQLKICSENVLFSESNDFMEYLMSVPWFSKMIFFLPTVSE